MPPQRRERRQATLHTIAQGRALAEDHSAPVCLGGCPQKNASYLQAQFQRLRHRRGPKKAICAVAASILTAVYHMLRDGTFYQDLGADYFRRASPEDQANRLARQIVKLGFTCTLAPASGSVISV
jgi:hypothetical protein